MVTFLLRSDNFKLIEKITNFERRRFRAIRTVNRVSFDVCAELLSNGSGLRLGRISGAHDFSKFLDGIISLENHRHDRTLGHELHEAPEKRPFLVDVIEPLSL